MRELVSQALRPEVGIVGARFLYPMARSSMPGSSCRMEPPHHQFRLSDAAESGCGELSLTRYQSTTVTGACLALRKSSLRGRSAVSTKPWRSRSATSTSASESRSVATASSARRSPSSAITNWRHAENQHTPEKRERMARELEVLRGRWGTALRNDRFANPNLPSRGTCPVRGDLPRPPTSRATSAG